MDNGTIEVIHRPRATICAMETSQRLASSLIKSLVSIQCYASWYPYEYVCTKGSIRGEWGH